MKLHLISRSAWCLALLIGLACSNASSADAPELLTGLPAGTYAWFKTNQGEFTARLYTDKAPKTTANFIGLAEGTKNFIDPKSKTEAKRPYYDGTIFHRVIDGFMIQGGDPLGVGSGGPGYEIPDEFHPDLRHSKEGLLSMANRGPNTGGSQFFVTLDATPHLDDKHAIFGEVVKGMDVVKKIGKTPTFGQSRPLRDQVIEKLRIYRIDADGKIAEFKGEGATPAGSDAAKSDAAAGDSAATTKQDDAATTK